MRALVVGVLWACACWITEARDDLLSSPLWIWGWVLLPLAAAALGRLDSTRLPVIAAGLTAPMAVAFVIHGDPPADRGPASWPIGVLLVLALGGICFAAARAGRATGGARWSAEAAAGLPDDGPSINGSGADATPGATAAPDEGAPHRPSDVS